MLFSPSDLKCGLVVIIHNVLVVGVVILKAFWLLLDLAPISQSSLLFGSVHNARLGTAEELGHPQRSDWGYLF